MIVFSGTPLTETAGAGQALDLLDADRRCRRRGGGRHPSQLDRTAPTPAGGYWLITTSSLADYPQ